MVRPTKELQESLFLRVSCNNIQVKAEDDSQSVKLKIVVRVLSMLQLWMSLFTRPNQISKRIKA